MCHGAFNHGGVSRCAVQVGVEWARHVSREQLPDSAHEPRRQRRGRAFGRCRRRRRRHELRGGEPAQAHEEGADEELARG